MHLELKRAKGLDDVAEDEEDVAHAQGAQQGVEQGRHWPAEKDIIKTLEVWGPSGDQLCPLGPSLLIILCRKAEDAEDVPGQSNRAKDDHEDPDNPEPEKICFVKRKIIMKTEPEKK